MNDNYYNAPENSDDNCMDWNDVIADDGMQFITIPEGDYDFTVTGFERGRYPGGKKLPPCNMAELTLQVKTNEGIASVRCSLFFVRTLEWRISSFFRSIGL